MMSVATKINKDPSAARRKHTPRCMTASSAASTAASFAGEESVDKGMLESVDTPAHPQVNEPVRAMAINSHSITLAVLFILPYCI
jgi:hypothetical protein